MRVKDLVKELTMTAGTVSSEMRRTMPTLRMQKTTASATNTAMIYDTVPVATPLLRANWASKATYITVRRKQNASRSRTATRHPKATISAVVTVRILPKRKLIRLGA